MLWAGQTADGIGEILSVATIMRRIIVEADAALLRAPTFVKTLSQRACAAGGTTVSE